MLGNAYGKLGSSNATGGELVADFSLTKLTLGLIKHAWSFVNEPVRFVCKIEAIQQSFCRDKLEEQRQCSPDAEREQGREGRPPIRPREPPARFSPEGREAGRGGRGRSRGSGRGRILGGGRPHSDWGSEEEPSNCEGNQSKLLRLAVESEHFLVGCVPNFPWVIFCLRIHQGLGV